MGLNVLVVDDSAVMRSIVLRSLRLAGLSVSEVCEAGSGEEALDVLSRTWIDLALIDLNMPGMDGEKMIERVRQTPETADLSIIVVSSESNQARIERLERAGIVFVHKPFEPILLREAICKLTGGYDGFESSDDSSSDLDADF